MNEKSAHSYLLANTTLFAQDVCSTVQAMTGAKFEIQTQKLKIAPFQSPYKVVLFSQFMGKITGSYVISTNEETALLLINADAELPEADAIQQFRPAFSELLKEVLNIAVGQSIIELEKVFSNLTSVPPTVLYGDVEFPEFLSANIEISGDYGQFLCGCSLNMANLKIGRKLDEALDKLDKVHKSQTEMMVLPHELPEANFDVYYKALNEAGGDFYDVFKISQNVYAYFVGDVAGHDIGSSLITASILALLKQNCTSADCSLSMYNVNNILYKLLSDFEYITGCYAVLDRNKNEMTLISMGHPPMLFIPQKGEPRLINQDGDVLGAYENCEYENITVPVSPGDRIFLYTDGLVEGRHDAIWSSGAPKLLEHAEKIQKSSSVHMTNELYRCMYPGKYQPDDDVVILGIEV